MEFTYTLTEDDYLKAAAIKLARPTGHPWSRILSVTYIVLLYLSVGVIVATGRILEWFDLTGDKLGNLPIGDLLASSIMPTAILPLGILILFRAVTYLPNRRLRREQFRSCIGCTATTTAVFSLESVAFRSEAGFSQSAWKCFARWKSQEGLLVIANHAGTRHIVKVAGLDQAQLTELMEILAAALPQR
ncbi:hypothetical protein [Occallatibacter savannae]|uniref:hypothetical protein n=1 Tax=Occallatibacter savannae TaxID=1002691 RepID=UPI000D68D452|nr:hypothetical protein [Occallatibacter savannae]